MMKTIHVKTCPRCGERPTVYTIKRKDGDVHGIRCAEQPCSVETGFSYSELDDVIRRWNYGLMLERLGQPIVFTDKPRATVAVRVDV